MIQSEPDGREATVSAAKSRWMQRGVLGAVCVLVVGVYAGVAHSGYLESSSLNAADTHYNLLVQGFRAGQLNLKKAVPPGFAQLVDPYDPTANAPYRFAPYMLHDLSYCRGRFYLYFGVTPALILFWPVALTGHYLFHRQAVLMFCAIGFLASVGLLRAMWRRYFPEVAVGAVVACALALGLATGVPVLLSRSDVYEVPISCGYMLTMLALGAIWCALHEPEPRKRSGWLAAASAVYGLAVGARPSLLLGAVILLVPVILAWRERERVWSLLLAAIGPILIIGLGLMLYNALRFGNPFEFGMRYQLTLDRPDTVQHFSLRYLWFNFRVCFLKSVGWSRHFPFVQNMVVPPLPPGHGGVEKPFGILTNIPLVWVTLAVPLVWRRRSTEAGTTLRWFTTTVVLLFGIGALTVGLYYCICSRFEVDFLPVLLLLAAVGILGLERVLAPTSESGLADRPIWRGAVRCGWGLLLGISVAFNLLAGVVNYADTHYFMGNSLLEAGKIAESIGQYEQALRLKPDYAEAHNNLGHALARAGRVQEAIGQYEQALRIKPDSADAHNNLGITLVRAGRVQEAIGHYEQALQVKPDFAEAHNNLGHALVLAGRVQEAIGHYEQALRIKPDYAEAHNSLGVPLQQAGNLTEAIGHYEQALQIKPDYPEAHNNLGTALWQVGRVQEAIAHYEQALRINPDYAEAHCNLGSVLEKEGRVQDAIGHYEEALRINPDLAVAQKRLARSRGLQ